MLTISKIISLLISFVYTAIIARYLGPANYGILAFALALNGILGVIVNFGLDPLTVREVARNKHFAKKYLANGIILKSAFGTLTFLVVFLIVNLINYPKPTKIVVYLITLSLIIQGISNLFNDIFQAFERMEFMAIGQILRSIFLLIFAIIAILLNLNIIYFAMVYILANLILLIYCLFITHSKFFKLKIEADVNFWKSALKEAYPFALTAAFISIYYWVDSVMLSFMKGDEVVGWYNAAYRLVLILLNIPAVYFTSIYPRMSLFFKKSKDMLQLSFERSFKYMAILAIPIGFGTLILADKIILMVFGEKYLPSVYALKILVWSAVFIFMSQPYGYLVRSTNRQSVEMKVTALGAFINIVLNIIFIPLFSYIGASFTTVVTEFSVLIIYVLIFIDTISLKLILSQIWKPLIASLIMSILIWYLKDLNIVFSLSIAIIIYVLTIGILKEFDETDLEILRKLFDFKKNKR